MTRKQFNEGFAHELWEDEQERQLFRLENSLKATQDALAYDPESLPGFRLGVGGVMNYILDAKYDLHHN